MAEKSKLVINNDYDLNELPLTKAKLDNISIVGPHYDCYYENNWNPFEGMTTHHTTIDKLVHAGHCVIYFVATARKL